jgi:tetratricopeptide (TPR) repeat protein
VAVNNVVEVLSLALKHHRAGNLREAEQFYLQILQADPGNADAHHLVGVVAFQTGRYEQAVASIRRAVNLNPSVVQYYTNLGLACEALGRLDEAASAYQQAIRLQPAAADAHNNLANLRHQQGRVQEAIGHCREALRCRPDFPEAHNNLGNALLALGQTDQAIDCFRQALRIDPNFPKAHNNLGNALKAQDRLDDAFRCYAEAVRLNPHYAEAFYNWGLALEQKGEFDEAGKCFHQALRINPNFAEAYNSVGIGLQRDGKADEAIRSFQEALRLKPHLGEACTNLGNVHWEEGRLDEALACYEQVVSRHPDMAEPHFNRARLWLLKGDWTKGWPEYEWRWRSKHFPKQSFRQPRWDGSNLGRRTILLYGEQGLGDTLQFIRYVPCVKQRGGRVILLCQAPLLRLLAGFPGLDQVTCQPSELPAFDVQAPLLSLPGILQTQPATVPYLHADAGLVEYWRQELQRDEGRGARGEVGRKTLNLATRHSPLAPALKVGIAWQGNPGFIGDKRRSIELRYFIRLAQIKNVQLISLQKGPGAEQLSVVSCKLSDNRQLTTDNFPVLDLGSRLDETSGAFMDTAAVMMNMDLVISSDTAVPHLAGALGVPVWVALARVPDWRWLLEREDSPWYPTMRLFRQKQIGQWDDVFERIAEELRNLATDETRMEHG